MKRRKLILMLLLSVFLTELKAQESMNASGGGASGSSGTVSYSIGQVVYTAISNANGNMNQGVQQPYEFFTTGTSDLITIMLICSVYPNPTTSTVTLNVDNQSTENLSFQLYDLSGKLLIQQKINGNQTPIQMEALSSAIYFLKVIDINKTIQEFKIIKNK
jgi:hypothetical protein